MENKIQNEINSYDQKIVDRKNYEKDNITDEKRAMLALQIQQNSPQVCTE